MLKIEDLTIEFGKGKTKNIAVEEVNISLNKGEALGIVGESGSGKSLTALATIGLLPTQAITSKGQIWFEDLEISGLAEKAIRKYRGNKICMIFQEPMTSLNPVMKCGKQVVESILMHQHLSKANAGKLAIELFRKVNLPRPENIFKSYPHELSGGQKQRIMIAMAIANNPRLLIADEPTTALDVTVQKEILRLLNDLRKEYGMGLIFISHDLGVIREVADRVAVMYKGRVVEEGDADQIFRHPKHPYTKGLLACRPSSNQSKGRLPELEDFINNSPGKKESENYAKAIVRDSNSILKVENLSKSYISERTILGKPKQYVNAVKNVSFEVFPGETMGLVGESGCGKTTLSRAILRLIDPDNGNIYYNEKDLLKLSSNQLKRERKQLNIVFQDPYSSLNPRITIGEAITEPMEVHGILKNRKERKNKTMELLEKVGLEKQHFNRYPHEFSGGQRQRIVIARALALNPKFIICDEAVSALDVSVQARVLNLLNDLKNEFGFTYIFISHDLNVVRYMSDRIMVMKDGEIVEFGETEMIYNHPKTAYTKTLIEAIPTL